MIEFKCPLCAEKNSVGEEFGGRQGVCAFCGAAVVVPQTSGAASLAQQPAAIAPRKSGTPWVIILAVACVVLLVCGSVLSFILLPGIFLERDHGGRRASCMNKLHQISLALEDYNITYGHLPSSGGPKDQPMSWRVAILPFLEHDDLYKRYRQNEPWDSSANRELIKNRPHEYVCPSDPDTDPTDTSYVMITGPDTIGGSPGSRGVTMGEITDGTPKTILVLEVRGLKIPWTEPRDITLDELQARLRSGGLIAHAARFNVGMADGSVHHLSARIDPETLRRLAIINDGQPVRIDQD